MSQDISYLVFSDEWGIIQSYEYKLDSDKIINMNTIKVNMGPTIDGFFGILWDDPQKAPRTGSIQMYGKYKGERDWFFMHSLEGVEVLKVEGRKMHFTAKDLVWDESINFTD